jgi:hypothetical protein
MPVTDKCGLTRRQVLAAFLSTFFMEDKHSTFDDKKTHSYPSSMEQEFSSIARLWAMLH